ncbi:MAG: glutamate--tRNA ligase [Albidovulum sp.]|nr:glutamate--tRNA ligase [Albidovulum sp.]
MTIARFAPSPTGDLHVGNLRTALLNWLMARKAGGTFILRIDDTDRERSKEEYVDSIRIDLEWLGLEWDRIERQSLRLDRYEEAARNLRETGRLYECFETPVELSLKRKMQLGRGKPPVYDRSSLNLPEEEKAAMRSDRASYWRFLLDRRAIKWRDLIFGEVSIDAASVSDPVLIRADGAFLYTLASVVDDLDMNVSIVVRGSDHLTNTATQVQIMQDLGGEPPSFAHHSLLTGPGGEPFSKRTGDLSLKELRSAGMEPMAILSLLATTGSSVATSLFSSLDELLDVFSIGSFGTAPTKFDPGAISRLTARHLSHLPYLSVSGKIRALGVPDGDAEAFWLATRENIDVLNDLSEWWRICSDGANAAVEDDDREFVSEALDMLPAPPFNSETWQNWTSEVSRRTGRKGKRLFMPLRMALTGRTRGPEMASLMPLMKRICR